MIGKQILAFGKSEISELINIGIFAASWGGRKGRRHIGRLTPDRERSHVWWRLRSAWASAQSAQCLHCPQEGLGPELSIKCPTKTDPTVRMPRPIWFFAGRTGYFVCFVMHWLKLQISQTLESKAKLFSWTESSLNLKHEPQHNQQSDCAPSEDSAWASAQSDQSLRCPHEESLGP